MILIFVFPFTRNKSVSAAAAATKQNLSEIKLLLTLNCSKLPNAGKDFTSSLGFTTNIFIKELIEGKHQLKDYSESTLSEKKDLIEKLKLSEMLTIRLNNKFSPSLIKVRGCINALDYQIARLTTEILLLFNNDERDREFAKLTTEMLRLHGANNPKAPDAVAPAADSAVPTSSSAVPASSASFPVSAGISNTNQNAVAAALNLLLLKNGTTTNRTENRRKRKEIEDNNSNSNNIINKCFVDDEDRNEEKNLLRNLFDDNRYKKCSNEHREELKKLKNNFNELIIRSLAFKGFLVDKEGLLDDDYCYEWFYLPLSVDKNLYELLLRSEEKKEGIKTTLDAYCNNDVSSNRNQSTNSISVLTTTNSAVSPRIFSSSAIINQSTAVVTAGAETSGTATASGILLTGEKVVGGSYSFQNKKNSFSVSTIEQNEDNKKQNFHCLQIGRGGKLRVEEEKDDEEKTEDQEGNIKSIKKPNNEEIDDKQINQQNNNDALLHPLSKRYKNLQGYEKKQAGG